jgi:hypothetical protein
MESAAMWKEWDVVTFSLGRCFDRRNASSICSKVYRQENRGEDDRLLTRPLKPARGADLISKSLSFSLALGKKGAVLTSLSGNV